uniref:Non-structural V protein n=1 Tax=Avian paramyxovirus 1 TaxID=2560319 RepID=A0A0A0PUR4_NCDV|nr:non-structural V protein [avian paramyxovirus 1]AHN07997.1 non-structural V protein [avian paramyxovirus 1]AHN07999.1 non-structural V protein [avian paramyxovirus 1]
MATFTDAEIDDIFETSGTVIDSIITAQSKPAETVGRSAIPQGKTKTPSTAWEKHGNVQPSAGQDTPDQQDRPDKQPSPPERATPHNNSPTASNEPPPTQVAGEAGDAQLRTGASNSLLSMLDKLSNKSSNAKKGGTAEPPGWPSSTSGPTTWESAEPWKQPGKAAAPGQSRPWKPGHRREHSISWTMEGVTTISWCNPSCAPVRAEPRQYPCICGSCPTTCRLCAGDDVYDGGAITEGK